MVEPYAVYTMSANCLLTKQNGALNPIRNPMDYMRVGLHITKTVVKTNAIGQLLS